MEADDAVSVARAAGALDQAAAAVGAADETVARRTGGRQSTRSRHDAREMRGAVTAKAGRKGHAGQLPAAELVRLPVDMSLAVGLPVAELPVQRFAAECPVDEPVATHAASLVAKLEVARVDEAEPALVEVGVNDEELGGML